MSANLLDTPEYAEAISLLEKLTEVLNSASLPEYADRCSEVVHRFRKLNEYSAALSILLEGNENEYSKFKFLLYAVESEYGENHPICVYYGNYYDFLSDGIVDQTNQGVPEQHS